MKKGKKIIPIIFSDKQYEWLKKTSKARLQSISLMMREFVNKEMEDETKQI